MERSLIKTNMKTVLFITVALVAISWQSVLAEEVSEKRNFLSFQKKRKEKYTNNLHSSIRRKINSQNLSQKLKRNEFYTFCRKRSLLLHKNLTVLESLVYNVSKSKKAHLRIGHFSTVRLKVSTTNLATNTY